jgi:hypothetical protein
MAAWSWWILAAIHAITGTRMRNLIVAAIAGNSLGFQTRDCVEVNERNAEAAQQSVPGKLFPD